MRKLIVAVGCLAIFGAGWCFGNVRATDGGSDWKAMSHSSRLYYIAGFKLGHMVGMWHGASVAVKYPEKFAHMPPEAKKDVDEGAEDARRVEDGLSSPVSSLESAVTTFYGDYRNAPVCQIEAILLSAAALAGNSATEQELKAARKKGAESGCR